MYISAEHSKVMSSTIGPGPKYDPLDSVGIAPLSINRTRGSGESTLSGRLDR